MSGRVAARVDGAPVSVEAGASLLEACDVAGRYVPRLCHHSAFGHGTGVKPASPSCGLCVVRLHDGSVVQACREEVSEGVRIVTDDPGLRKLRLERLAAIVASHPMVCLDCPDREGCTRDSCAQGIAPEARCCDKAGGCELGRILAFVDPLASIPRRSKPAVRDAAVEGAIRRELGLCVACGRCVVVCSTRPEAGGVLEMVETARPIKGTLRASGCTFCGSCVAVCPTGALTAPGPAGARWLSSKTALSGLAEQVLPPEACRLGLPEALLALPHAPGVFTLYAPSGELLRISGVPDLADGVGQALHEPAGCSARWVSIEEEQLFTQRETELIALYLHDNGRVPVGNEIGDDLFDDDLD